MTELLNLAHRDDEAINDWFKLYLDHIGKSPSEWAKEQKRQSLQSLDTLPGELVNQLAEDAESTAAELEQEAEDLRARAEKLEAEAESHREEADRIRSLGDHDFEFEETDDSTFTYEETLDILAEDAATGSIVVLMEDDRVETLMRYSDDDRVDAQNLSAPREWYVDIGEEILDRAGVDPDAGVVTLYGGDSR